MRNSIIVIRHASPPLRRGVAGMQMHDIDVSSPKHRNPCASFDFCLSLSSAANCKALRQRACKDARASGQDPANPSRNQPNRLLSADHHLKVATIRHISGARYSSTEIPYA